MKPKVLIIDYGRGNLFSICRALAHVGAQAVVSSDPAEVRKADRIVLPGVGAFGDGMDGLRARGLIEPIKEIAASGRPLLGICLGMQLLLSESSEFGTHEGLGIIPGKVIRFSEQEKGSRIKVPHVGWSPLLSPKGGGSWDGTLLRGQTPGGFFYFVHSYYAAPADPEHCLAETPMGKTEFCSVVAAHGNIVGCQFHPEKSGEGGLALIKNWIAARPIMPPAPTEAR